MGKRKRLLALLMAALLLIGTCSFAAAEPAPTIQVNSTQGKPGETVTVTTDILNNPGIAAFILGFSYDKTRLQLKNVELNPAFGNGMEYKDRAIWYTGKDISYSGQFLTLTFDILSQAPLGDAAVSITYNPGDIVNYAEQQVPFQVVPGKVTVCGSLSSGDLNGNGRKDAEDLTILARYLAGKTQLTADQMYAADVDGQPGVSADDLTVLARAVAHIVEKN